MALPSNALGSIRFAPFELWLEPEELRKHGARQKLSGQALQVLVVLATRPNQLVTREELQQTLWPGASYGDFEHGLNATVNRLREVLGDSATNPRYIETVPRRGYRFIASVETPDGQRAPVEVPPITGVEPSRAERRYSWKIWISLGLAACAVVAGLTYLWLSPHIRSLLRLSELQRLTEVPLTSLPGNVVSPTFSPDGGQIAFGWETGKAEGFDLYVKSIGTDTPLRLTHHPAYGINAAWAPDGRTIAVSRIDGKKETSGVYLVPSTGGPERRLVSINPSSKGWTDISWSPDGKYIAFSDHPADAFSGASRRLYLLSLETQQVTPVSVNCETAIMVAFSPRGDSLAWVCSSQYTSGPAFLRLLRLSDGSITQILERRNGIAGIAWSGDGRHIVFSSNAELWEVALDRPGQVERLPVGHDARELTASRDGHRLAYVRSAGNINIWRVDLTASPAQARMLVVSSALQFSPSISPDGKRITFESDRNGSNEIWVCDADGSDALQLTSFGIRMTGSPRWSPDGKQIVFDSRIDGEANLYVIDPAGGAPHRLDIDVHGNSTPNWSADGQWIYFSNGDDARQPSAWKVPAKGGHAVRLAEAPASYPMASPDGIYVYFYRRGKLWRVRTDGSGPEEVPGMPTLINLGEQWFPTRAGIYFFGFSSGSKGVDFFDFRTGKVRRVYTPEKPIEGWIGAMPVSPDGRWLLYPQVDASSSNLMMIENWR